MKKFLQNNFKVGFIGGGNICEAMVRGIILSGYIDPGMILVSTLEEDRRHELHQKLGVRTNLDNIDLCNEADILFIAVRPNEVAAVCDEIKDHLNEDTLLVSIAAGTNINTIQKKLNNFKNIARIMPNLPVRIKAGTTAAYAGKTCNNEMFNNFRDFLSGCSKVIVVDNESLIDPITVLSSSAPAYYVMIADALIKYGVSEGIPEDVCTKLVLDTMSGSAQWALGSLEKPGDLWPKVITKGGVTAAGMDVYREKGLIEIFVEGLRTATQKARSIH
ncbi:MAG: pyrroline-5-carboxylate reductase [Oligoflexia bacterium]|nr:pyrroline-5-carboxylate reductase [Oligoflexia bacterium]